jgi:hypothetical protein
MYAKAEEERAACKARVAQLEKRESEIAGATVDAERELEQRLTELRQAVAGQVKDSPDLKAVRTILARLFEMFMVVRATPATAEADPAIAKLIAEQEALIATDLPARFAAGGWIVHPLARDELLNGLDERWQPILQRESLIGQTKSPTC